MCETIDNKPNIFNYATKELSQDAVICWLIEWSSYGGEGHDELRECGQQFVKALFDKHDDKEVPENCGKLKVWRQDNNIDVLVKIGEYVLLIEDKKYTGDHSGQLERYYQLVLDGKTQAEEVDKGKMLPIYLKTGNQSLLDRMRIEHLTRYKVFDRRDFLDVVRPYKSKHPILNDFTNYLECADNKTLRYCEDGWKEKHRAYWTGHNAFYDKSACNRVNRGRPCGERRGLRGSDKYHSI